MTTITRESTKRLLLDVRNIIKNPLTDHGIFYIHDDSDMLKGYAMIVGPEGTPYFGGYYFFELAFPCDYPHSPPKVTYCTNGDNIRFNPNLYKCGKVCVSLLNTWRGDQWTSCQSISTVLLTLVTLLCKDPLLNEPGINLDHPDVKRYNSIIEYANISVAIYALISKKEGIYQPFFESFYPLMIQYFKKNIDKILIFSREKIAVIEGDNTLVSSVYQMRVKLDYSSLVTKLEGLKHTSY